MKKKNVDSASKGTKTLPLGYYGETKRRRLQVLYQQLSMDRFTFEAQWRDLGDYILPTRTRFQTTEANRGDRKNTKIYDSTATLGARTLSAGMMSGVTSPARPWYRLSTQDPDLAEIGAVKDWLHLVTERMQAMHLRTNLYNVLPVAYGDLGTFGTAVIYVEEDFDRVMRFQSLPIGSYWLAKDETGRVNTLYREFRMTVRQLVEKFGGPGIPTVINWEVFSERIKTFWDNGQYETWIDVCHVIQPNSMFDPSKHLAKFKRFESVYYERGTTAGTGSAYLSNEYDRYLRESGYDTFPVLVPRWMVTGEDVYGTSCPGMDALGDTKQLQLGEKRAMQAIEKMVNPPMVGPAALRQSGGTLLPGGITYIDERDGTKGFRPAHEVKPQIQELEMKQEACRKRIDRCMYADLFLMLSSMDERGRDITAREIQERHEEKLLALGPVLEQLNQDALDPLIDLSFQMMDRQGLIPPPPQELHGMPLKVEYISVMAQAQKLVGISSIERLSNFAVGIAVQTKDLSILDNIDQDQMIDDYADACGVSPKLIRPKEEVQATRQQRQQAQQQQQQMEQAQQAAGAAKDLSQTDTGGGRNALSQLMEQANAGSLVQ